MLTQLRGYLEMSSYEFHDNIKLPSGREVRVFFVLQTNRGNCGVLELNGFGVTCREKMTDHNRSFIGESITDRITLKPKDKKYLYTYVLSYSAAKMVYLRRNVLLITDRVGGEKNKRGRKGQYISLWGLGDYFDFNCLDLGKNIKTHNKLCAMSFDLGENMGNIDWNEELFKG